MFSESNGSQKRGSKFNSREPGSSPSYPTGKRVLRDLILVLKFTNNFSFSMSGSLMGEHTQSQREEKFFVNINLPKIKEPGKAILPMIYRFGLKQFLREKGEEGARVGRR